MPKNLKVGIITMLVLLTNFVSNAQCFEIESILVDACEGTTNAEGQNEMVRFKVGNAAINTAQMTVTWPSNTWGGLIQNANTAQKVALINEEITAAGGCGTVLEPTNGVLPANATVILVSSHLFDVALNPFGAINEDIYILFQNSTVINGHFANFGEGNRSLTIRFGNACNDSVTYNRSLLVDENGQNIAANGATVNFTANGVASYTNFGCAAPVSVTSFDIVTYPTSTCSNSTITLVGEASNYRSIRWESSNGVFSSPNQLTTQFTVNNTNANTITISLIMVNLCDEEITKSVQINLESQTTPIFNNLPNFICNSDQLPVLPTVSSNGIRGTWSPASVLANYDGVYTFTPAAGQCATIFQKRLDVTSFNLDLQGDCAGSNYVLKANVNSTSTPEYIWKDNLGRIIQRSGNEFNVTEYLNETGIYFLPIRIHLEASIGECTISEFVDITSLNCAIQKGISPNFDNKNDFFDLRTMYVLKLTIYNRYGKNVYEKGLYKDEWIGQTTDGEELPSGTYFYEIHSANNGIITGWIELLR